MLFFNITVVMNNISVNYQVDEVRQALVKVISAFNYRITDKKEIFGAYSYTISVIKNSVQVALITFDVKPAETGGSVLSGSITNLARQHTVTLNPLLNDFLAAVSKVLKGGTLQPADMKSTGPAARQAPSPLAIAGMVAGALLVLFMMVKTFNNTGSDSTSGAHEATAASTHKTLRIGDILHTTYFDVVVSGAKTTDRINTGNPYTDVEPQPGNKFIALGVTFTNTDNESRLISEGELLIDYNGKRYRYDHATPVLAEGYNFLFEQINPLTSKSGIIIYEIPAHINGTVYYHPGRSSADDIIYLGAF